METAFRASVNWRNATLYQKILLILIIIDSHLIAFSSVFVGYFMFLLAGLFLMPMIFHVISIIVPVGKVNCAMRIVAWVSSLSLAFVFFYPYKYVAAKGTGYYWTWTFDKVMYFELATMLLIILSTLYFFSPGFEKLFFAGGLIAGVMLMGLIPLQNHSARVHIQDEQLPAVERKADRRYLKKKLYQITRTYDGITDITLAKQQWPKSKPDGEASDTAKIWVSRLPVDMDADRTNEMYPFRVLKVNGKKVPDGFENMTNSGDHLSEYPQLASFLKANNIRLINTKSDILDSNDDHKFDQQDQANIDKVRVHVQQTNDVMIL